MRHDAERYDEELDEGREPPVACPVCTGDEDAEPCGEECAALIAKCARKTRIKGFYISIRTALFWARTYYGVDKQPDARVLACVDQINRYRKEIRALRAA